MDNKEFKDNIDLILKPLGFKRKGNFWRLETTEIEKVIYLQKSDYSNSYYLDYGYNLKNLDCTGLLMHIFNGLSNSEAFDLEKDLDSKDRIEKITKIFERDLFPEIDKINSELDLINLLKKRSHLNDIPFKVKEYLKLNK